MKLPELMRAIGEVAQTGGTTADCDELAREAGRLADMVGWATGPIDPKGQLLERLATLQEVNGERPGPARVALDHAIDYAVHRDH